MRYFIHLAYHGSNFSGWQRQKNTTQTIQEVIENTLFKLFKKEITVYGCGRTDAGVHASQYVMHINLDEVPDFELKFRLNKNLPDSIAIYEVIEMAEDKHCRYDATSRTYDYFIHWNKDSELYSCSSYYEPLHYDFEKMKQAAKLIEKNRDFKMLCKHPNFYKNTKCLVTNCEFFVDKSAGRMRFSITSNRFLRGMVRYCVFFILEVGTNNISVDDFEKVLNQQLEYSKKKLALPNGLFLSQVKYPYLELENKHPLIKMLKMGLK